MRDDNNVTLDAISNAPKEEPPSEPIPKNQDPLTCRDGKLDQQLGSVGKFVGGGPEKAGNIALIVIVSSFVLLVLSGSAAAYFGTSTIGAVFDKLATGCISLITGSLGFIFGKSTNSE